VDLLRSWGVAVAVYVVGSVLSALAAVLARDPDLLKGAGRSATWAAGSALLIYLLMAAFAALVHPAQRRHDPVRHAIATLGIPAVAIVAGVGFGAAQGVTPAGNAASAVAAVAGALTGWGLVVRLRARRTVRASAGGY
jgi:hypothetical protein